MKKVEIIEKLLYILLQKFVCMTANGEAIVAV
ncbi:hypothetical protein J2S16_001403 [Cytobacillus kochii]|nr:hypothetical protein [Cytobacillus kochii]